MDGKAGAKIKENVLTTAHVLEKVVGARVGSRGGRAVRRLARRPRAKHRLRGNERRREREIQHRAASLGPKWLRLIGVLVCSTVGRTQTDPCFEFEQSRYFRAIAKIGEACFKSPNV